MKGLDDRDGATTSASPIQPLGGLRHWYCEVIFALCAWLVTFDLVYRIVDVP